MKKGISDERVLVVNKYPITMPGGVETAFSQQLRFIDHSKAISLQSTDWGQFNIAKWRFSLQSLIRAFGWAAFGSYQMALINTPSPILAECVFLFAKLRRKPVVIYYHAQSVGMGMVGALYNRVLRLMQSCANVTVTSSKQFYDFCDLKGESAVIPFTAHPLFEKPGVERVEKIYDVVYFGRISAYKNIDRIIQCAKERPDWRFVISGPQQDFIFDSDIPENCEIDIRFLAAQEVVDLLRSSKIFMLPSTSSAETFGICQVEALASGCALIRYDNNTGVPEVARGKIFTETVSIDNTQLWLEGLDRLMSESFSQRDIVDFYLSSYGAAATRAKYQELLERV